MPYHEGHEVHEERCHKLKENSVHHEGHEGHIAAFGRSQILSTKLEIQNKL